MRGAVRPFVGALALLLSAGLLASGAGRDADEEALRTAGVGIDGPSLLQFFRNRTVTNTDRDAIAALVKQLGDDEFNVREKASAALIALGARAEPQLREAAEKSPDAEVKRRAEDCLRQLAKGSDPNVIAAAARLLGARKPTGAAEVLLAYLPGAPGEAVAEAVGTALAAVAVTDGKADPAAVKALEDKLAVKRAAAAVALCRGGAKDELPAVRKLLKDAEASVRLKVAVALALARDKEAVPVLIELLADLRPDEGYEVEDILRTLAGDAAPDVVLGKEAAERKKARDAWAAWWKKDGDKADLAKLADGVGAGRTLILVRDTTGAKVTQGRVVEVGRDGKVRWQIEGLRGPVDAQPLPGGRVLICEATGRRITERTPKGEVVWEKALPAGAAAGVLLSAQRLASGNTFVATRTGVLEIDRDGKEVWSYRPSDGTLYAARKGRNGEVAIVTIAGTCVCLDADHKEAGTFTVPRVPAGGGIDVLPNGNVLIPDYIQGKVIEYDAKGKAAWEAALQRPASAVRLANGHTLVSCPLSRRVVELDRDGKEVWKCDLESRPYKAFRR
jgi:HEAT repeat protein